MSDLYLAGQYDLSLVLLSYCVACFAAYSAIDLTQRIFENPERQWLWLSLGALAMGCGIWSMHFIGMQAFSLSIPLGYDLVKTLVSLLSAIAVAALALYTASRKSMGSGAIVIGAALMGIGISVMHYTGMAAMEMQPGITYDPMLFAASVLIAVAASGAALWILHHLRRIEPRRQLPLRFAAAAVMGFAVVGMHYTGMAAANFATGSICGATGGLTGAWTAGPVTAFSVLLAGMIMLLAALDAGRQTRLRAEARERQEEARARFLAFHDPVTRLPNRTHFKQEIVNFIGRAARSGKSFDLYYCVFQLTGLRDTLAIDEAALTISSRLRELARPGDMLVRHDRAEFLLVRSRSDAGDLPPRVRGLLLEACRGAVNVNGSYLIPEVHVGCAEYPKDGTNSRNLLLAASRAPGAPRAAMHIPSTETDAGEAAELRHRVA